jgi:hypothetical protein
MNGSSAAAYNDYIFDPRNRLDRIDAPWLSQSVAYSYDPNNQRLEEQDVTTTGTVYTEYAYDPNGVLAFEMNKGSLGITDTFLPDRTGGVAPVAHEDASGSLSRLFTDNNGSVQAVLTPNGLFDDAVQFDGFGNKRITDPYTTVHSIYGFQGMLQGTATSMSNIFALNTAGNGIREEDVNTGMFIEQDPKGFGVGDPNLYRFGDDNPVNNTHPTGLEARNGLSGGPVPWGAPISSAPWENAVPAPNLSPQAGNFGTGQTPLQQVPGTAYTPWWQSVARAAASAPAPAAGPSIADWVAQQTTVPADILAAAPSAASIISADTAGSNQQQVQVAAAFNPQQAAANSTEYPSELAYQAQYESDLLDQQLAATRSPLGDVVSQYGSGLLDAAGISRSTFTQSVNAAASIFQWGGLIAAPIFGIAGSIAAASDAAAIGGEAFLGGEALEGGGAASETFLGGQSGAITRPIYPPGSEPVPGLAQNQWAEFNSIIEQAYANNPAGSELMAAMGNPINGLTPGQAGGFGELNDLSVVGDQLTPHHMPQAALGFTGYDEGGAIVLPQSEHALTKTYLSRGAITAVEDAGLPFRTVLTKDIKDLRNLPGVGSKYNAGIQDLLDYYRQNFPQLIAKPR